MPGRSVGNAVRGALSVATASCLAAALLAGSARAQSTAAAEALFNDGRAAMDAKNYDLACQRFRESNRIDPALGTTLNLAVCEEDRGKLATAWELLRAATERMDATDPRRKFTTDHLAELEPRLPKLTMTLAVGAPDDTTVRDGGTDYSSGAFGVPLPMDPGKHALLVSAKGHAVHEIDIELGEGVAASVEVSPGPAQPDSATARPGPPASIAAAPLAGTNAEPAPETPPSAPHSTDKRRLVGFVLGGVGVASVGVGIVTGILALSKKSSADAGCDDQSRTCSAAGAQAADSGRTLAAVSTVSWLVGAAGLGAGAYLILTSAPSRRDASTATEIHLGIGEIRVSRRF